MMGQKAAEDEAEQIRLADDAAQKAAEEDEEQRAPRAQPCEQAPQRIKRPCQGSIMAMITVLEGR